MKNLQLFFVSVTFIHENGGYDSRKAFIVSKSVLNAVSAMNEVLPDDAIIQKIMVDAHSSEMLIFADDIIEKAKCIDMESNVVIMPTSREDTLYD